MKIKILKIVLLLTVAYVISSFAVNNIFIAQSPKVNPFFAQNMMARVDGFWSKTSSLFAFKSTPVNQIKNNNNPSNNNFNLPVQDNIEVKSDNSQETLPVTTQQVTPKPVVTQSDPSFSEEIKDALTASLTPISQGVYAGEREGTKVYEIRTDEIDSVVYIFQVNGKEIKIKVPKDKQAPTQEDVEAIFK